MSAAETLPLASPEGVHTISLFVNNKPGVLVRVALAFARRGWNIDSLVVSPGVLGEFSRMTITCTGDPRTLDQMVRQLQKLVDVVHAIDHTGESAYETEIALVKISAPLDQRTQILQISEHYKSKVVDYGPDSLVLQVYGASEKVDAFVDLLRPFNIIELVRSGKLLMARGHEIT